MIQTYSSTIRRKEMDAVLTCMVDEKIGPGELNARLIQQVKEFFKCDGAVALRSPAVALKYILLSLDFEKNSKIMISALAPAWQYQVVESLGYEALVLDVSETDGLVTVEEIQKGMQNGGRLLLLHETEGILPDFDAILSLGIPVIEDISQSAGASVPLKNEDGTPSEERKKAGLFGLYTILGLEEKDVITHELSKIKLNGIVYNIKDSISRNAVAPPPATETTDGLLSADDKRLLNSLNPNIAKTISNLNASEFGIINAKNENALSLAMAVEPTIS